MAQYAHNAVGYTPVNHADSASSLANASYQALRAGAATAIARLTEAFIGGEATTSTVNRMALRRLSTNATTPTDVAPGPLNPWSAASVPQGYVAASTGPTIAATQHLGTWAFNAFGGLIRWVAAPGQEVYFMTATAPNAEIILDSISGTGVVSQTLLFEQL